MTSPSIVFIQVDQLTADALRCYGNNFSHAPNLERLASNGWVFEKAYCNFPLCAPSRFSMATGKLCSAIGAYDNAAEMPASIPTYAHYLKTTGYQTALSGKMHFIGPDQYHGFDERLTPDLYPADFSWVPNWGDEGDRDTNDSSSVLVSGICERSVQIDFDNLVTYNAIQFLYDTVRKENHAPFFLQISYTHPHEPYLCRKPYWDLYENVDIPLPTVPAFSADKHDAHSQRLLRDFNMMNVRFADDDIQRARRAYFGSVSYLDEMIGQILEVIEATGLGRNTAIIFTSDHGEMLGERGMWFKKHFFEPSLRVPLIMRLPDKDSARIATPVSLVDLLPTFMSLAVGDTWQSEHETLDGNCLLDIAAQQPQANRRVYAEYLAESTNAPIFMIYDGRFKYISSVEDEPLMFDVSNDPRELNNIARDSCHASIAAELQHAVAEKWDSESLTRDIVLSQKRRRVVLKANARGTPPRWNHNETIKDDVIWYRGEEGYNNWAFAYLPGAE